MKASPPVRRAFVSAVIASAIVGILYAPVTNALGMGHVSLIGTIVYVISASIAEFVLQLGSAYRYVPVALLVSWICLATVCAILYVIPAYAIVRLIGNSKPGATVVSLCAWLVLFTLILV